MASSVQFSFIFKSFWGPDPCPLPASQCGSLYPDPFLPTTPVRLSGHRSSPLGQMIFSCPNCLHANVSDGKDVSHHQQEVTDGQLVTMRHCRGRQCPRDDRRPCFSHRVSSARGVTSVHGHQRINNVTSRQWEPTTCQLSVRAPHPNLLPAPKSLTSAHEVTNQL